VKLEHLVGFIIKKFVTIQGQTKVKNILFTYYEAVFPLTQHTINFIDAVFMTVVLLIKGLHY